MKFGGMRFVPFHHILIIVKLNGLVCWNYWFSELVWWECWHIGIVDIMD